MKRVLLFVAIMLTGLFFENRLNKSPNQQATTATVTSVEKIKNKKKGDKPFVYRVNVSYENDFGRQLESSFTARSRPAFDKGEEIPVIYSFADPSSVHYERKKIFRP
ncbi:MAG: DUF3592 domain-containing protein [Bacteroidota bacterium]